MSYRDHRRIVQVVALVHALAAIPSLFAQTGAGNQVVSGQLLVKFKSGANVAQILNAFAPQAAVGGFSAQSNTYLLNVPPAIQAAISQLLAAHPLVNFVEPNHIRTTAVVPPNDPQIKQQWALTNVQAIQAWSYFPDSYLTAAIASGSRVMVAVVDTGADCTHPDFMNAGGTTTNTTGGGQLNWAASIAIVPTTISNPTCPWQDDFGHGTHTAGIVAAATDNATGVASLGFPLQLAIFKVLDNTGSGTDYGVAQGIYDAVNAGAQVVSMSLGGTGYSQTMQQAMDYAWEHNVLVVAAAGNTGNSDLEYPGAGNHVLGVAATDDTNTVASFSTYGNWAKIAAPGVNVLSTLPIYTGPQDCCSYGVLSGTSMATPHVAALAGLLFAANPGISVAEVAQRIQETAQSPNSGWNEHIGYGIINAGAALGGIPGAFTTGSLTGQAIDENGNPLTGVTVTAGSQSYTTIDDPSTGDPTGLFRISGLSPGIYSVTVSDSGYQTIDTQAVIVAGADTMELYQLGTTGSPESYGEFTGTVSSNSVGVSGAVVQALSSGAALGTAITNSSGSYTLTVPPGTYTLLASAPNYIYTTLGGQSLSANGTVTANLALTALGTISGAVTDVNGLPVANAHIDFSDSSYTGGATANASGNYASNGIPAGTYTVTASASGYTAVATSGVSVANGSTTLVNFQFSTGVALSSGLLAYWPFNEGTGNTAFDQSGNGYNASLSNTTWTSGVLFPSALSFNATNSSGVSPTIPFTNTYSLAVWVHPSATAQNQFGAIAETSSGSGPYLGMDQTGTKYKFFVNTGTGSTGTCAFQGIGDGCAQGGPIATGWHFLVGTYDGTTAILYLDGAMVASDTFTAPASFNSTVVIGPGWNGALQSLRLYGRALTVSEVTALDSQVTFLSLTKTADAANVTAGGSIGYTLTAGNSGSVTATSVALNDTLPTGTGVSWSIGPAYSGPGTCSITGGVLGCSFGSMSSGGTASVHVTSATTTSSCGVYPNTASASASNGVMAQSSAITTVQCSQTITFPQLASQPYGSSPTVSATSSSGLTVSFNSQTGSICTISSTTVMLLSVGTCTIQATQSGNNVYFAATSVDMSFTVTQGTQTIDFPNIGSQPFGTSPTVSATATSGQPLTLNSQTGGICSISGSTVSLLALGTCTIQATQGGNTDWQAAVPVNMSFTVTQGTQTINFLQLASQPYGTSPTVNATATSGQPVSYTSQTGGICSVSGSTVTLLAPGTCTIQATQSGNTDWQAAVPVNMSFTVTQGTQTINFPNIGSQAFGTLPTVSATATSGQPVTFNSQTGGICSVAASTVTLLSVGGCTIQATQTGTANWQAATPVNMSFTVTQGTQTINFPNVGSQAFGASPTVSATASSGQPVTYNSQTGGICSVSGSTVTLLALGTCTIQATQTGTANWQAAVPVNMSFTVTQGTQTINFPNVGSQQFGTTPTVSATATSGIAATFNSQTGGICSISVSTVTLLSVGTCTIQAIQNGSSNWQAAVPVTMSFTVTQGTQTINFPNVGSQAFGASPTLSATATSGQPVTLNSQTGAICSASGNTVTLLSVGTCTIQATQNGTTNWQAATPVNMSFTVTQGTQSINFPNIGSQPFGTSPTVSATATSGQPVTFNSQTGAICSFSGNTATLLSVGTCTIQATQNGSTNWQAATPVNMNFTITQGSQSINFPTIASQVFGASPTVSATATSGQPVTFNSQTGGVCSVSGNTVTLLSVGTCTIQATQTGATNWQAATPVNMNFTITQGSQSITFNGLANEPLGTAPFNLTASATSGQPVSFVSLTGSVCGVSGGLVSLSTIGACTIQASQNGNANWIAATPVSQSFTVTAGIGTPGVNSVSFANTLAGKSSVIQFAQFKNTGNTPLTIAAIAVTGADSSNYQYTADPSAPCPIGGGGLAAGATCTLDIVFTPQSQGPHSSAQLTITDNSGNVAGATQSVGLSGAGIVLSSIAITANSASLGYNTTEPFSATGTYSDNSTATLTGQVTWASSATGVATINSSGIATGASLGQTSITAALSGVTSNTFQLTVVAGAPASISVASGSGQSATVGAPFAGALQALVVDSGGNPVPNASVTFNAPVSGASATFSGTSNYSTTTNSSGIATSLAPAANSTSGSYTVTASVSGVAIPASFSLTNIKLASLSVTETPGTFVQGQMASYTITLSNAASAGPTYGTVTVTQTLPAGLTLVGMSGGPNWNCSVATGSCSTTSVLNPGASVNLTATVAVAYGTAASASSQVGVSWGGSFSTSSTYSAVTTVFTACDLTLVGTTTVTDVQTVVNEALGSAAPRNDLNGDGVVNVVDMQIMIRSALGGSCSAS